MIGIPRSNSYKRHWIDGVQCDQMAVSILGHLEQVYFAQKYKIFAKEGSQFHQILNSYAINVTFCPGGKISPNLVTLMGWLKSE